MAELRRSLLLAAYRGVTAVSHPLAMPILAWRRQRGKEEADRLGERRGEASAARPDGPLVWIHAASVGETLSVLPLIERILAAGYRPVLLTTGTVTSARIAESRLAGRAIHQYVPMDGPRFVRSFLDHWRPSVAVFVESELWPNLIEETARSGTALVLVNARMSDRSYRRWRVAPGMVGAMLSRFALCLAQSEADAVRLRALGASAVVHTGNLKYDVPAPPADGDELARLGAALGERPRWAAASLHPGEDEPVLAAHRTLAAHRPGLLTIIVPRHPERGPEIAAAALASGLTAAMRSRGHAIEAGTDVYVFDTIGEMGLVYRLAPVVFMGGSLVRHGGQNPIEPAKLATAILHGPHVRNFAEVYAVLHGAGGAEEIARPEDLPGRVAYLLAAPERVAQYAAAANAAVGSFAGALDRTMSALAPVLAAAAGKA